MSTASFDELVESSITGTLSRVLGSIVWQSISFFFEPKSLSHNPDALPELLTKLFGTHANVLERVIAEDLLVKVGVPEENRRGSDFRGLIRIAKARFISTASSITRTGSTTL